MRYLILIAALAAALVQAPVLGAEPSSRYETRSDHSPDGIGKFYMGREIAHVMGPGGIIWLEREEREKEERPQMVLNALELKPGDVAVDLGAGSGYYTFPMARLVAPNGKVLAIDVSPQMLAFIDKRAKQEKVAQVRTIKAEPHDPNITESVDVVLLVDVYHELEFPYEVMNKVRLQLKPRGRVVLVEYRAEDPNVPIKRLHTMSERQIIRELAAVGLRHVRTIGTLPMQHIVVFERAEE